MKAGVWKDWNNLSIMETLSLGSGLDLLISLGELQLYDLLVPSIFYLRYLFCISKGTEGISAVSLLLKVLVVLYTVK